MQSTSLTPVLQLAPIGPWADRVLADDLAAVRLWEHPAPDQWLRDHGLEVRVAVTSVRHGCPAARLAHLPGLRALCSWGAGYETLPMDEARRRGLLVSNTPDVLDECVADMAWALMLASARTLCAGNEYVKTGQWVRNGDFPLSSRVWGKRLGILGLGRIGAAIARRGNGFNMDVRYHARGPRPGVPYDYEPNLLTLASWCDFLVVACVGGPQTQGLVSADVIHALGPQGILVNIARGSVIDQDALIDALSARRLGAAGLDVVDGEPGAPATLCALDNVTLMPHVGSATHDTRLAMEQLVVDNVRSVLDTGQVLTPVP